MTFVRKMFSSTFVLNMHLHKWDDENRTMASPSDEQKALDKAICGHT